MPNGKRLVAALLATGLLLTSVTGGLTDRQPSGSAVGGRLLYVGGNGSHNYTTIQAALDVAANGDTVFVYGGTYHEHLVVRANITLRGESTATTVITGDFTGTVLQVQSTGVTLRRLQFVRAGGADSDALVHAFDSVLTIEQCLFSASRHGVLMERGRATLANCSFHRTAIGVMSEQSTDVVMNNCTFTKNGLGVLAVNSTNLRARGVMGSLNGVTIMVEGCTGVKVTGCTLSKGNENQANLYAGHSSDMVVDNCTIYHSGRGIRFWECRDVVVQRTRLYDSKIGIEVSTTSELQVTKSEIYENDVGIYLFTTTGVAIHHNAIFGNDVANLAAEGISGDARHNWWGPPLAALTTIYVKQGRLPVYPWLKENPLLLSASDFLGHSLPYEETEIRRMRHTTGDDTDGDGCPDWWEEKYGYDPHTWDDHATLDPDTDGLSNVEEYLTDQWGSHPFRPDLFVEIDVMRESARLATEKVDILCQRFAEHNITLHLDTGNMGGGEVIPARSHVTYATLVDIYWEHFLDLDPTHWRKGVFHYALLADSLFQGMPGFVFIGWDEADAFALSLAYYDREIPAPFRDHVLATVWMHELGHTLGLFHDVYHGIDNESTLITFMLPLLRGQWTYRNYRSCMNYQYAWQILDYSDGTHGRGDFDDWSHLDLTFFQDSHWG